MAKLVRHLAVIIPFFFWLTACVAASQGAPQKTALATPSSAGKMVLVTPSARGNTASLDVGDTLEIKLPTIPEQGYTWKAQDLDSAILEQVGEATYVADTSPNSAGGMTTLQFTAVGKGKTTLNIVYTNQASTGLPSFSSSSFSVTIEVN